MTKMILTTGSSSEPYIASTARGLACTLLLSLGACSNQNQPPTPTDGITRSIKTLDYRGPSALCSDIADVLANPPPDITAWQKRVAELSINNACRLSGEDITQETIETALGDENFAFDIGQNAITIYARSDANTHRICCSLQPSLLPVGQTNSGNLFAARYRLSDLQAARLEFRSPDMQKQYFHKGPLAPQDLSLNTDALSGHHSDGILVSASLDETRGYQLYTPPEFNAGDDIPIVIIGDGVSLGYYIRQWEPLILDGTIAPFIGIGVKSGKRAIIDPQKPYDFDVRNADYIKNYSRGPQRFDAHLKFVTDELLPAVTSELSVTPKPETTILMGGSSAGSFAMWGVLSRPDIFGHAVAMSPSGPTTIEISPLAATRNYYISAGLYEPNFHTNAEFYQNALEAAGAAVDFKLYPDGHSSDHRALRMVDALRKILPAQQK